MATAAATVTAETTRASVTLDWHCHKCGKAHEVGYTLRGQATLTTKLKCRTCGEGHTITLAAPQVTSDAEAREAREATRTTRTNGRSG